MLYTDQGWHSDAAYLKQQGQGFTGMPDFRHRVQSVERLRLIPRLHWPLSTWLVSLRTRCACRLGVLLRGHMDLVHGLQHSPLDQQQVPAFSILSFDGATNLSQELH